jgi:hypothetical protein
MCNQHLKIALEVLDNFELFELESQYISIYKWFFGLFYFEIPPVLLVKGWRWNCLPVYLVCKVKLDLGIWGNSSRTNLMLT